MIFIDNLNRYVNQTKWSQFSVGEERWQALSCYVEKNQSNSSSSSEIIDQAKLLESFKLSKILANKIIFRKTAGVFRLNHPLVMAMNRLKHGSKDQEECAIHRKRFKSESRMREHLKTCHPEVYVDTIDPNEYEYDRKNVCQILYVPVATIKDENMSPNCAKEKPKIPIITLSSDDDNGDNKESIDQNQNEQKKRRN
ncbi:hypothetical protein HUG17_6762 [Dermatophagoides farinae]|uniref:Uncharacterized protein n=1 Tax=Dermatophagoides farinae TaxID=6954 RepID=A0A9D4P454_DERFA|nr:hypothetical protein HUG17_6762 [Dermatophagoides farinae]